MHFEILVKTRFKIYLKVQRRNYVVRNVLYMCFLSPGSWYSSTEKFQGRSFELESTMDFFQE